METPGTRCAVPLLALAGLAAALLAAVSLAGSIASAEGVEGKAAISTEITVNGGRCDVSTQRCEFWGVVTSPRAKCVANRTVEAYATRQGAFVLFDTDRTSTHGEWAVRGKTKSPYKFKVLRKGFGRGHRPCGGAVSVVS